MPVECLEPQPPLPSASAQSRAAQAFHLSARSPVAARSTPQAYPPHNAETMDSPQFKSDEFRMLIMKVQPCSKRFCHDWTVCPFAHPGEKARRRDPRVFNYTGIACPEMKKDNNCPRGDSCPYAHNVFEYWLHPTRYRTQLCNDGERCARHVCFFAHSLEELRVPATKPFVSPEALAHASMESARTSLEQQSLGGEAHALHAQDLAAQLAWLQLGGGLDHGAPPAPNLSHRILMGQEPRSSLGEAPGAMGDQVLNPNASAYLSQLARQHQLQLQLQQQQQQQQQQRGAFSSEQQRQQALSDHRLSQDHVNQQQNAQPEDFAWTQRITRARSKSDPLDLQSWAQQQPNHQAQDVQQQPSRSEGRSLDAALRALQLQPDRSGPGMFQGSNLFQGLSPDPFQPMHEAPAPQRQRNSSHSGHSGSSSRLTQGGSQGQLSLYGEPQPLQSYPLHGIDSSSAEAQSRHERSSHSQESQHAMGMLWGSSSGGGQAGRASLGQGPMGVGHQEPGQHPQQQQQQQLPLSASGHPLRSSFQQHTSYVPSDPQWERDRHQQYHMAQGQAAALRAAEQEGPARSSMSSSRTSGDQHSQAALLAGSVPDYSSWLLSSSTGAVSSNAPPGFAGPQSLPQAQTTSGLPSSSLHMSPF
ncbi:hypothetical protein WJX73_002040 [Symbiochloris irregularis]|uniref:C3H1-type domain-containing protein n=1 Tax=Symbiochloris irregularis TaxID=706552 RepID=A0AAW1NN44_9CHLO